MKEADCFFPNALPENGRRMTKGSGCSACYRGGVTYGYMGCLRKGRVRQKAATQVRRSRCSTDLRRAFACKALNQSNPFGFTRLPENPRQNPWKYFPARPRTTVHREILPALHRDFSPRIVAIFQKNPLASL